MNVINYPCPNFLIISGFALPTIRYAGERKEIPETEENEHNPLR